MELTLLKAKLHQAVITQTDLDYEGSVTIDAGLLKESGILPFEQVDVYDITNGARFTTYAIEGDEGTGIIGINGAAARLVAKGDLVIICAFARMTPEEAMHHAPTVLLLDEANRIRSNPVSGHA